MNPGHHVRLPFLTPCPDNCSSVVSPPLSSSDFSLTRVKNVVKAKTTSDALFHRAIFRCSTNWDALLDWDKARLSRFFNVEHSE